MNLKTLKFLLIALLVSGCVVRTSSPVTAPIPVPQASLPANANSFLDSLSRDTFNFFWELAEPSNGNQPDRWPTPAFSSIAATGFGLTSYLVGVERGFVTRDQAADRVLKTLQFFHDAPTGEGEKGNYRL